MKSLDLGAIIKNTQTFPIKLLDGTTVNVLKPTQALLLEMTAMSVSQEEFEADPTKAIEALFDICGKIMNNNKEGYDIDVSQYPTEVVIAIINAYQEFTQEVLGDPNLKSPQSQAPAVKKGKIR